MANILKEVETSIAIGDGKQNSDKAKANGQWRRGKDHSGEFGDSSLLCRERFGRGGQRCLGGVAGRDHVLL